MGRRRSACAVAQGVTTSQKKRCRHSPVDLQPGFVWLKNVPFALFRDKDVPIEGLGWSARVVIMASDAAGRRDVPFLAKWDISGSRVARHHIGPGTGL